jgi:uncharacterized membrane protein YczE
VSLVLGLFLCACGIVAFLESGLGLPPWDVLHQGIASQTPLSFGTANLVVGLVVLVKARLLGARIGVGTIANALLIGSFLSLLLVFVPVDALAGHTLAWRVLVMLVGIACFGVGSALYIGAAMGAGPRDSLMLVGSLRTGFRIRGVRTAIEAMALAIGLALGGSAGVGTLAFALLIGPSVELSFRALDRTPLTA